VVDLDTKSKGFYEQLRAFRDRDKALNDALVSAQQLRNEIRESSEREASLIVREARAVGEEHVEAARAEVRRLEGRVQELERARRAHLAQLRQMAERQLAEITAAEQESLPALPGAPVGVRAKDAPLPSPAAGRADQG
jgi:cell division septum initiation protein DivIVA